MSQPRFWHLLAKKNSGEASPEEIQELQELMRLHPEWHYSAQHIQDIWGLNIKEDPLATEEAFQLHLSKMKKAGIHLEAASHGEDPTLTQPKISTRQRITRLLIAASVTGLAVLSAWLFTRRPEQAAEQLKVTEVSTRMGSRSELVLPDGSIVWLNAGSKLTYSKNFGTANRDVTLVGEAYFDVKRMPELPFIIQTPAMQVKVLGTRFNVKSYPGERSSETSVIRGSVEVVPKQRPNEKYVLRPNEKLVVANTGQEKTSGQQPKALIALSSLTYYRTDSVVVETSWVDNKLVFDNEPFADVALKMERWYGVTIEFRKQDLKDIHLTGSFVNETIYEAMKALQLCELFDYEIHQNTVIIKELPSVIINRDNSNEIKLVLKPKK